MSIWKSQSISDHLLSSLRKQGKYPDDVWSVTEDHSSLCYVLCVTRKKENGEPIQLFQKISREEFEKKPDIVHCIARSMTQRLTQDCRRANQQDRHMPSGMTDPGPGPDFNHRLREQGIPVDDFSYVDGRAPIKFFRCNKEVTEDYADSFPEPLDELRLKVALWLR